MRVSEYFLSIQGEGPQLGLPAIFIRFSGCNLSCQWCDSKYASEGTDYTVDEIINMVSAKSVIALCWKAGLDIKTAVLVQKRIAHIPPSEVQGSTDDSYPYTDDEMGWQLDFIKNPK